MTTGLVTDHAASGHSTSARAGASWLTTGFDFAGQPRIVFGPGSAARLAEFAAGQNATRVLVVSDPGVISCGHADPLTGLLRDGGMAVAIFGEVRENPTRKDVESCVELARAHRPDLIVAIGGGSTMDVAKACNMVCAEGPEVMDRRGLRPSAAPHLPMIAIPTTAGTGSECQAYAVISDDAGVKGSFATSRALPRVVLLDPTLTTTQPRAVTANSGFDAIVHAVEVTVTTSASILSSMLAAEAFTLLIANLPVALDHPDDLDARSGMQLGAALAGLGIAYSMLGAAHAAGNSLMARMHMSHGESVALMLPAVIRFNAADEVARARYGTLAARAGLTGGNDPVAALLARIHELWLLTGHPGDLSGYGIRQSDIDGLAEAAAEQWTAKFNPRPADARAMRAIFADALTAKP